MRSQVTARLFKKRDGQVRPLRTVSVYHWFCVFTNGQPICNWGMSQGQVLRALVNLGENGDEYWRFGEVTLWVCVLV